MTYSWFNRHREMYPEVTWPGSHMVVHGSRNHTMHGGTGFSFLDFLAANYEKFPGGIYIGGSLGLPDHTHGEVFEWRPHGFVHRLEPKSRPVDMHTWRGRASSAILVKRKELPTMPPLWKYSNKTWEWTISQDYWRGLVDYATQ